MTVSIRPYRPGDAEALAHVYRDAVTGTGATAYDPPQIQVWAAYPEDMDEFRRLLGEGLTLVAVQGPEPVAFGQLSPPGHIALLYTATHLGRQGLATAIYRQLEAAAVESGTQRLTVDASRIARHFFLKMGFRVVETEFAERNGVRFERFRMEKMLV